MKERVAILGAAGFIGKAITSSLSNSGIGIEACDLYEGNIDGVRIDPIDITKEEELSDWLNDKDISGIIYLSCIIPKSFEGADWDLFYDNLMMHRQVMDYWRKRKCHLIYASSSSVYIPHNSLPWREDSDNFPNNFYSISKLLGEKLFFQEYQNGTPLTILRINAPFGAVTGRGTVVNIFLERALKGEDLTLYGTGNRQQDFIHVSDVARAFLTSYLNKKHGIFNIASGRTVTMRELAETIIDLTGSSSKIIYPGKPDPQEGFRVEVDITKARDELGFTPELTLEDGLRECIREYLKVGQ